MNEERVATGIDIAPIIEAAINCGFYFLVFLIAVGLNLVFPDWTRLSCALVLLPYPIIMGFILVRRMTRAPWYPVGDPGIALSRLIIVWAILVLIAFGFAYMNGLFAPLSLVGKLNRLGNIAGAPLAEEFVFRAALLTSLNQTELGVVKVMKVPVSVVAGAAIFSVIHLIIFALAGYTFADAVVSSASALILGLACGALYVRTQNVWYGVFLHTLISFGQWG